MNQNKRYYNTDKPTYNFGASIGKDLDVSYLGYTHVVANKAVFAYMFANNLIEIKIKMPLKPMKIITARKALEKALTTIKNGGNI